MEAVPYLGGYGLHYDWNCSGDELWADVRRFTPTGEEHRFILILKTIKAQSMLSNPDIGCVFLPISAINLIFVDKLKKNKKNEKI